MRRATIVPTLLVPVLLAGCSIGPRYKRPDMAMPSAYKEDRGAWRRAVPAAQDMPEAWWRGYGDPVLNALERQVATSNQTVKTAEALGREAVAAIADARSSLFPTVGLGDWEGRMVGTMPRLMQPDALFGDAAWKPDIWGELRHNVESASDQAAAATDETGAVILASEATLARSYFALRAQDEIARLLQQELRAIATRTNILRNQFDTGTGDDAAVLNAETAQEEISAQLAAIGTVRPRLEHAIAVLTGNAPAEFSIAPASIGDTLPIIPAGLPSVLLERRPDIAAAERRVMAANAQIGMTLAAWYPDFTLSASSGYASMAMSKFLQASNSYWALGLAVAQTIFDGGRRQARVTEARLAYEAKVAAYRQTVLDAFRQVEDNLSSADALSGQLRAEERAAAQARASEGLAQAEYRAGEERYPVVLLTRIATLRLARTVVQLRAEQLQVSVALIEALGGGWKNRASPAPG